MPDNSSKDDVIPRPDPTLVTNQAIDRATHSQRELFDAKVSALNDRLEMIEKSVEHRQEAINSEVGHLQHLHEEKLNSLGAQMSEKFASVGTQFKERDTRSERESRDNKVAVDAAFAAQKEAAAKQDEANQKAIDKSEKATAETITKLSELFKTTTDGLVSKIDDLKVRLSEKEGRGLGAASLGGFIFGGVGMLVGVVGVVILLVRH